MEGLRSSSYRLDHHDQEHRNGAVALGMYVYFGLSPSDVVGTAAGFLCSLGVVRGTDRCQQMETRSMACDGIGTVHGLTGTDARDQQRPLAESDPAEALMQGRDACSPLPYSPTAVSLWT